METIQLDCAPGYPRPGDLINGVVEGTGLVVKPVTPFFGLATYSFDVPRDVWERDIQPVIIPRITALYNSGSIRYGSW